MSVTAVSFPSLRCAYGVKAHLLNMIMYMLGVFPLTYLIVNLRPNLNLEKNVTTVNMVTKSLNQVQDLQTYFIHF